MRNFDENLNAYHALNAQQDVYIENMTARIMEASTQEEANALLKEGLNHILGQGQLYKELGEEMVQIMSKKWWQFWK